MDIQKIRDSRKKGVAVFTKFCEERKRHEDCIFCFFEGEDLKYYGPRIEQYTNHCAEKIVNYNCGGRSEVLRVYYMISGKPEYSDLKKMFFIDRDYTPLPEKPKDIYQTPCYSIENFYTSKECFAKYIMREFGINSISSDYQMCIGDYLSRQQEFHDDTLFLNAWLSCQRKYENQYHENRIKLSDFKLSKLFSAIRIDGLELRKEITPLLLAQLFPSAYDIPTELLNAEVEYFSKSNQQQLFRGKFEFEFFKKIIESLKLKNTEKDYFQGHYTCVYADVNVNPISALSGYADTPDCLIGFLRNHCA